MLRIAICDDEPAFLSQIHACISAWSDSAVSPVIDTFDNGDSLLRAHTESPYDILFLDVVMPLFNGIEVAKELRQHDISAKIVFLTSSPEYAVDSYTVKASNYLLKPLDPSKLYQCLDELSNELKKHQKHILIKYTNAVHKIPLEDIEYVEAQNKHTLFTLRDRQTIDSTDPLYLHEDKLTLEDGFFKCHRSYLVNINYIDTYTTKEIRMRSGYRIPVSRNCQSEFEAAYFAYTFRKAGEPT